MNRKRLRLVLMLSVVVVMVLVIFQTALADTYLVEQVAIAPKAAGETDDEVEYDPWDIVVRNKYWDDYEWDYYSEWWKLFDGEEWGLGPKHKINAISIPGWYVTGGATCASYYCGPPIFMSFVQSAIFVPGITPKVNGQDVVVFDPEMVSGSGASVQNGDGPFYQVIDGSDVGLTTNAEKIDGLDYWPELITGNDAEFPYDCNAGVFFISTMGNYRVPAANGGSLVGRGSDVLMFCATNLGPDTAGYWFNSFDGVTNDVDPYNAINGLDVYDIAPAYPADQVEEDTAVIWFTFIVRSSFTAPGVAGGTSEAFAAGPIDCDFDLDCYYWFEGPWADFNQEEPALNGTPYGFDGLYFDY